MYSRIGFVSVVLLALAVFAGAVEIDNPGFESPSVSDGTSYFGLPAGWGGNGTDVMVKDPGAGAALQASEGQNYVYLNVGTSNVKQWVGVIEADTAYVLKVDVGVDGSFSWYQCGFAWYSGTMSSPVWGDWVVKANHNTNWPVTNGWTQLYFEFNSFNYPELVGKLLRIELTGEQIAYDNVQYSDMPPWDGVFNGGFEYDAVSDGQKNTEDGPSGWNSWDELEIYNPYPGNALQPSEGDNMLRVVDGGIEFYPRGGIHPKMSYTVEVDVARVSDLAFSWYEVLLRYHDGSNWQVLDTVNHISDAPSVNSWRTVELNFATDNPADMAHVGQMLRVTLTGQGVVFDNVRITQAPLRAGARDFYISSSQGDDGNDGLTAESAYKTFDIVNGLTLIPGDRVLLKRGDVWDQELHLWGQGAPGDLIELGAYGTGTRPMIKRGDMVYERCVVIESPSHWAISDLDCRNGKVGVYLRYCQSVRNTDVTIDNCYFQDLNQAEVWNPSDYEYELSFNAGVMAGGKIWKPNDYQPIIDGLTVTNCGMERCIVGVLTNWYYPPSYRNRVRNLVIEDCWITGSYGLLNLFHVNGGHAKRCHTCAGNSDFFPLGTTAAIIQSSQNFTIDSCTFAGASRQGGGADACSFDFEGDTRNVTFSNNVGYGNDGQSLLILSTGGPHVNLKIEDCTFYNNCKDALLWSGMNYEMVSWENKHTGSISNVNFYRKGSYGVYSEPANFASLSISNVNSYNWDDVKDRPSKWEFETAGDFEGWSGWNEMGSVNVSGGRLEGVSTGGDPYIFSGPTWINAHEDYIWKINMMQSSGSSCQLFFITDTDPVWDEAKSLFFNTVGDGSYHEYVVDMSQCEAYKGVITKIRIDPAFASGVSFGFDSVRLDSGKVSTFRQSYYPQSYNLVQGSYVSGDVSKLRQLEIMYHNPNDVLAFGPVYSGGYKTTVDYNFTVNTFDPYKIDLEVMHRENSTGFMSSLKIYLYNYDTGQWDLHETTGAVGVETLVKVTVDRDAFDYVGPAGSMVMRCEFASLVDVGNVNYQYVKVKLHEYYTFGGDTDRDGDVDGEDLGTFANNWLGENCNCHNHYGGGADIDMNQKVNLIDHQKLAESWGN